MRSLSALSRRRAPGSLAFFLAIILTFAVLYIHRKPVGLKGGVSSLGVEGRNNGGGVLK